jgi:putative ATP-dependent endonuclease of the OLD family
MTDTAPSAKTPAAAIYALTIERFRGITSLKWKPSRGVNVILGGGDVGKTALVQFAGLPIFASPNALKAVRWLGS